VWWSPGRDKQNGSVANASDSDGAAAVAVAENSITGEQWVYQEGKDFTLVLDTMLT